MKYKIVLLIFSISFLTSCSVFGPVKSGLASTYVINPCPPTIIKKPTRKESILVAPLAADPTYNTDLMAYSVCPHQIAYFAKNGWVESPTQMLHPLIVETLQNTHHFHAVNSSTANSQANYILATELIELIQIFKPQGSSIHLRVRVQILNANSKVIATREFCIIQPALCCTPYGGVMAANKATQRFLVELAEFVLHTL